VLVKFLVLGSRFLRVNFRARDSGHEIQGRSLEGGYHDCVESVNFRPLFEVQYLQEGTVAERECAIPTVILAQSLRDRGEGA
jgi:hypothetical protein